MGTDDIDDSDAGRALLELIHDPDPVVAAAAIAAYSGPDLERELSSVANNRTTPAWLRLRAAGRLHDPEIALDSGVEAELEQLAVELEFEEADAYQAMANCCGYRRGVGDPGDRER